jgi:hypothetical protein
MEKIKRYWWIIFIILVAGIAFYWYSYRPYHITKFCIKASAEEANKIHGNQTDTRYLFWQCQKFYGLTD